MEWSLVTEKTLTRLGKNSNISEAALKFSRLMSQERVSIRLTCYFTWLANKAIGSIPIPAFLDYMICIRNKMQKPLTVIIQNFWQKYNRRLHGVIKYCWRLQDTTSTYFSAGTELLFILRLLIRCKKYIFFHRSISIRCTTKMIRVWQK